MKLKLKDKISKNSLNYADSLLFASLLTLSGGLQDGYSYKMRGGVFSNAQTGNIVLLAQNLSAGNFSNCIKYLIPLISFFVGVYITVPIYFSFKEKNKLHWIQIVLLIEAILFLGVGFMPKSLNSLANAILSFSCAMQVNAFRSFRGLPSATTMCIGNMRSLTDHLSKYHFGKNSEDLKKSMQYLFLIVNFFAGAVIGAIFHNILEFKTIWISSALITIAFFMMFFQNDNKNTA